MAKTKAAKRKSNTNWSGADHSERTAKRILSLQKKQRKKQQKLASHQDEEPPPPPSKTGKASKRPRLSEHVPQNTYKRTHLAHDNVDKIELSKLRLATSQIQRQIDSLKSRLESWDPNDPTNDVIVQNGRVVSGDADEIVKRMELDASNRRMDEVAREKAKGEQILIEQERGVNSSFGRRKANLRKKPRPGPETWKLRGAARPAWQVYDFDTRYVDPHIKALEAHNERMKRTVNIFSLCRGRFAMEESDVTTTNQQSQFSPPQPHCRTYLSLLTQLGSLHLTRKNYSSARASFSSAIELEGYDHPISITNARYQLMNMYLSTNRPAAARKLWNALPNDGSAWIRYSAALIEYVSWNLLGEAGSTRESAEMALAEAIRGNVYVVYYLGWKDMFDRAMEYTADVVEWGDGESGSIMEAVEYYGCGLLGEEEEDRGLAMWLGTDGSLDWVRSFVLRILNGGVDGDVRELRDVLLGWEAKLANEEEKFEQDKSSAKDSANDELEQEEGQEDEEEPDLLMYAGMFRTAMDWLQDAGEFKKSPTDDFIIVTDQPEKEKQTEVVEDDTNHSTSGQSDTTNDNESEESSEDDE